MTITTTMMMNFTTEHTVPLYDLVNNLDLASNMTLNYTEVVWNVSTTVTVGTTFSADESERVAEVIAHYHAVARTIWRIWPPIALGKVFSLLLNKHLAPIDKSIKCFSLV